MDSKDFINQVLTNYLNAIILQQEILSEMWPLTHWAVVLKLAKRVRVRLNHFIHSSSANYFLSFASSVPFNNSGHIFKKKCKKYLLMLWRHHHLKEINLQWGVMYLELESCWVSRLIMEMYIYAGWHTETVFPIQEINDSREQSIMIGRGEKS